MDPHAPAWLIPKALLLLAGLLVPGAVLMRALRLPATLATAFAGSALAIYTTVLGLQFAGIRISLGSLTCALGVFSIACFVCSPAFRRNPAPAPPEGNPALGCFEWYRCLGPWLPLYALFCAAILWRAWHEPLAGPDIEFRWSFLAEQMLRVGSLDFYPPRSAADFVSYFWAESIPPGVSALHAWAYACAGSTSALWTVPAVVLQFLALHELIGRTAWHAGGPVAARFALIAAAACPLLSWAALLGQETGLTAIATAGIAFAALRWRETRTAGAAALIGVFASIGASAREYGLVFPAIAALTLLLSRADRRAWLGFALPAALGFVWPLRTLLLTGNPFHSLNVAGLFPVNPRFLAWIEHDADALGAVLRTSAGWLEIARFGILFAASSVLGWMILVICAVRRNLAAAWALGVSLIVIALWAASVRYTNGGLFYSLRVTTPALALGAIAVGCAVAAVRPNRPLNLALNTAAALLLLAMFPATLALPHSPWRAPIRTWPAFGQSSASSTPDPTLTVLLKDFGAISGAARTVLADAPGFQRRFLPTGIRVIPLWSPQADWLFDRSLPPAEALRRGRESGISHIIITKWQTNIDFFNQRSRWSQPPFQMQLVGETPSTAVFAIRIAP